MNNIHSQPFNLISISWKFGTFQSLKLVCNFDLPLKSEDFIWRLFSYKYVPKLREKIYCIFSNVDQYYPERKLKCLSLWLLDYEYFLTPDTPHQFYLFWFPFRPLTGTAYLIVLPVWIGSIYSCSVSLPLIFSPLFSISPLYFMLFSIVSYYG